MAKGVFSGQIHKLLIVSDANGANCVWRHCSILVLVLESYSTDRGFNQVARYFIHNCLSRPRSSKKLPAGIVIHSLFAICHVQIAI